MLNKFLCCLKSPKALLLAKFKSQPKYKIFDLNNISANCYVNSVYDGDTIRIIIPIELRVHNFHNTEHILINTITPEIINYELRVRLYGIDTPEIKPLLTIPNRKEHIDKATLARDYLSSLILNKIVKIEFMNNDKYGRPLVNIFLNNEHINDLMITNNHAKPYFGKKKLNF